jgi:SAM-dependent methyltransferase
MKPNKHEYVGRDLEVMNFAERYHRWILDEFRAFLGPRVGEVGAGTGAFSELLLQEPGLGQLIAIEPSARMHDLLVQRLARDARAITHCGFFEDVAAHNEGALDALLYVNVLEHIEDDRVELAHAYRALRPGGHLCVFVPALSWLYSRFDASLGHYRRYHKDELLALLRSSGFQIAQARYFDMVGILPWLLVMRLLRQTLAGGQVRTYDRWVVPVIRRFEAAISAPLGKNVIAVARKPLDSRLSP